MKHSTGVLLLLNCMPLQVGLDIKVSIQIAIQATKCFGFEVVPDFGPRAAKRRTGYNITNQSKPGWSKLCESSQVSKQCAANQPEVMHKCTWEQYKIFLLGKLVKHKTTKS